MNLERYIFEEKRVRKGEVCQRKGERKAGREGEGMESDCEKGEGSFGLFTRCGQNLRPLKLI